MLNLKQFRDEAMGLSDLLNYACVIADGVVLCKDGALLGGWYYRGDDVDSSTAEELSALSARINASLARFGNGWTFQIDAIRRAIDSYPMNGSAFPDTVTRNIDEERRVLFRSEGMQFETIYALLVTYLPPLATESRFYTFLVDDPEGQKTKNLASKHLGQFELILSSLEAELSSLLKISRISSEEKKDETGKTVIFDNLLQYINFAITGDNHPIQLPSCPMYIDSILGWKDFTGGLLPTIGEKYIRVIAIDGFPQDSFPAMLSDLDQLSCEYRWHTRFIFMDREKALGELKNYRKKWGQKVRGFFDQVLHTSKGPIDQNALSMVSELDQSLASAEGGLVSFGYYTTVVVVMNKNRDKLEEDTREIIKVIKELGFSCRKETLNVIEAWLGSLPSHTIPNVRRPLMHTLNVADLLPMTSIWAGEAFSPSPKFPDNSPPLMQVFTGGHTPFRFNLHVSDVGHTVIIGPTGSGKSTLLAMIGAQFMRYKGAKIFAFDKGYSLFSLATGVDGIHYDVAGEGSALQFCPLASISYKHCGTKLGGGVDF